MSGDRPGEGLVPHPDSMYISAELKQRFGQVVGDLAIHEPALGFIAMDATELAVDKQIVSEATQMISSFTLKNTVEISPVLEDAEPMTLDRAAQLAAEGDPEALAMVRLNVKTDYIERAYKSGIILRVELGKTRDGNLIQYGQLLSDMHKNSLRYITSPVLQGRTKTETVNGARYQYYADSGVLKDNIVLTFSPVTSRFTEQEARKAKFFTDTMSVAAQVMSEDENGVYVESAFVAGRESSSDARFDEEAIRLVAQWLGLDFSKFDADEMLAHPIIIPKVMLSSALDVVKLYDKAAYQVSGQEKFFGRAAGEDTKDYEEYIQNVEERIRTVDAEVEETVMQLIAAHTGFKVPTDATRLLDRLNDALLKERIVDDTSIDAGVLGEAAAYYVNHARYLKEQFGLHPDMVILQQKIESVGESNSCPDGSDKSITNGVAMNDPESVNDSGAEVVGDCEFVSKECPKCHQKNVPTRCEKGVYIGICGCRSDRESPSQTNRSNTTRPTNSARSSGKRNTSRVLV